MRKLIQERWTIKYYIGDVACTKTFDNRGDATDFADEKCGFLVY